MARRMTRCSDDAGEVRVLAYAPTAPVIPPARDSDSIRFAAATRIAIEDVRPTCRTDLSR